MDSDRTRLYQAMSHLTTCRKSLEDNAEAVKAAIRDSVAKQVDAMRRREQWLIQQVELVQADQVDQLRRQERCLQKTLTARQTLQLPLMPAEPPLIGFAAESAAMHEAISQYGRIVCGYAQSPSTFSSATPSLPGPVEEYDEKEDEACWEHKSLGSGIGSFVVRLPPPRTPPKIAASSVPAAAVASLADSFEVLSAGSLDEDKTRWLINYVCRANETCSSKADCLCDGGCFAKGGLQGFSTGSGAGSICGGGGDEAKIRQELEGSCCGNERWLCQTATVAAAPQQPPPPSKWKPLSQQLPEPQVESQLLDNWRSLSKADWLSSSK